MSRDSNTHTVSIVSSSVPYALPSSGQVIDVAPIGANVAQNIRPGNYPASSFDYSLMRSYSGGCFAEQYSSRGAYVITMTGGHNAPEWVDAAIFDFNTGLWSHLPNANGFTSSPTVFLATDLNGTPNAEILAANPFGIPASGHQYLSMGYWPPAAGGGTKGSVIAPNHNATANVGSVVMKRPHKIDLATGLWTRVTAGADSSAAAIWDGDGISDYSTGGAGATDVAAGRFYLVPGTLNNGNAKRLRYIDFADSTIKSTPLFTPDWPDPWGAYPCMAIDPVRDLIIIKVSEGNKVCAFQRSNLGAGPTMLTISTNAALPNGQYQWVYYPPQDCFYVFNGLGNTLYRITPPATLPLSNPWVVSTVTIGSGTIRVFTPTSGALHYNRFFYVPALLCFGWIADAYLPVQLIKP